MTLAGVKKTVREIMSEPNGGGLSWGRVASSVALLAAITWVTRVLLMSHAMPGDLSGITGFVVAPYTGSAMKTAVQSFSQNPVSAPPAPAITPAPPMQPPPMNVTFKS